MRHFAFVVLLLTAPAFAQDRPLTLGPPIEATGPKVTLPATKKVLPGERFAIAPVVTNGGTPRLLLPDSGLKEDRTFVDLLPEDVRGKLKGWVLYADVPPGFTGTFRVYAYAGGPNNSCSDATLCLITVGDPPPAPPGPTPGPTPPGPTPPTPGDPLAATLAAAYKADGSPAAQAKALASLYRLAATTTVNDASLTTLDALVAVMHKAADSLMPPPTTGPRPLAQTRDAIKADLAAKVGTKTGTPLDAPLRKALADAFARYAALLDSLAK